MKKISTSIKETKKIGREIAKKLKPSDIVALFGNLGSGKTTLVKGIAEGLGAKKDFVLSPSFVILREYKTKLPLYHFDLYRLKKTDVYRLGFDEYFFAGGISVIEWADRIIAMLPGAYLRVDISVIGENKRLIKIAKINNIEADKLRQR